jgi:DNA polymerase III delta subunit
LVHQAGKSASQAVLQSLMERQDLDEGIIVREMEKLINYTGDQARISEEDVKAICGSNQSYAVWQSAEKVVFEGTGRLDEDYFHALVPALRAQLQQGLKMATLLAENAPQEAWQKALPKVFPKTLEKRTKDAARLGVRYFVRGLETLFTVELKSRTGSNQLGALLDFFQCSLYSP